MWADGKGKLEDKEDEASESVRVTLGKDFERE